MPHEIIAEEMKISSDGKGSELVKCGNGWRSKENKLRRYNKWSHDTDLLNIFVR